MYDKNLNELKAMSQIVLIPAMQAEFWKMMRLRDGDKVQAQEQKQAIQQMIEWNVRDEKS